MGLDDDEPGAWIRAFLTSELAKPSLHRKDVYGLTAERLLPFVEQTYGVPVDEARVRTEAFVARSGGRAEVIVSSNDDEVFLPADPGDRAWKTYLIPMTAVPAVSGDI